jgi:hypothetical protein
MKTRHKISLIGLSAAVVALLGSFSAVHAQINTGIEYGSATGLGGGDIRTIVGRIIQVFLGILGVVALVLIIYAGFLWMTAGGDEEKVTQAKKIMTQAVIGLAIILCSFAITSWVVSQLTQATGYGGTGGGESGGGGSLGSGQFAVASITPPGSEPASFLWPKNSHITVVLKNGDPDPSTITNSISVTANGLPVSGTITANGNVLIFAATAKCVEDPSYTCLPGNSVIAVTIAPTLKSTTGNALSCGECSASFSTSDLIETQNPTVSIVSPSNGASVSTDAFVPVISDPQDSVAVASVELFANGVSLGSIGVAPWQEDWDTTGIPIDTVVTLSATVTNVVGNTGLAQPITVTVRPAHCFDNIQDDGETGLNCGDDCGACAGGSCTQDADCASGLCQNGVCVNRPRIDSVTPLAGGPGTLVSITGASFGAAPGQVTFLGDKAADAKVAAPCAPSAWTDTQIVVGVPEGAVTGPLEVTNSDNLSDRTDDDFGNTAIPDFTVNTTVVPGICTLTPNSGPTGTTVTVSGNGFGDTQTTGSVAVAERTATITSWSGTQIAMTTPNLLGGTWPVVVTAAGTDSNSVGFTVPDSVNSAPHLDDIEPGSGPVGQYVTLTGTNFGTSPGKVEFISGAYSALGGVDFPPACGNAYWTDTSVTVTVPDGLPLGDVDVKLTRADAVDSDNTLPFTITTGNPSAGICRINPTSGPVGTSYEIDGERLGTDQGRVVFWNNVDASSLISAWDDGRVAGTVPADAATGEVYAVSAAASQSNPLNFEVADCRTAQVCSGSETCCDDGTCRLPNDDGSSGCTPPQLTASYRYRYSTGDIPVVPQVVDEIDCAVRSQSPSPYKGVTDACANSVGSVRFTVPMDPATLIQSNFKMADCGDADTFDATACTSELDGTVTSFGAGQTLDDGMQFLPAGGFKPNEWYQGTIAKTVTSSAGVPMDNDYVWNFRVRNSPDPCEIASVTVAPAINTLTDIYSPTTRDSEENISYSEYKANPADDVCNVLDCTPYVWAWASDNTQSVGIVNPTICTPEVQALAETDVATPATITAMAQDKAGTGQLTIKFAPPQVIDEWPACQAACLNAQVAASFNVPVTNVSNQTVKLFACDHENCDTSIEVGGYTVSTVDNSQEHLAVINPPGTGLLANQYYRVVVLGGADGVLSVPGAQLVKTNYVYGTPPTPAFSWIFRTTDQRCTVDHVDMSPTSIYTKVIDSFHSITAVPVSAPDSCSATGERLDQNGLDLAWSVAPVPGAAQFFMEKGQLLDVSPLASNAVTSACLNAGAVANKPVCGNGIVENGQGVPKADNMTARAAGGGEECDLGALNGQPGSGCSANCLLTGEPEPVCTSAGQTNCCGDGKIETYTLGDGITQVQKQCDLGSQNGVAGSGCSTNCLREGSDSTVPPTTCGNGDLSDNKQCDLGSLDGSDSGCSSECLDEGSVPGIVAVCGDKNLNEPGKDCDLGALNGQPGSGCSANCLFTGEPACTAAGQSGCCGDGNKKGDVGKDPSCDLGWDKVNNQPEIAEGCDSSCRKLGSSMSYGAPTYATVSVCGDGVVGTGESADPGGGTTGNVDATQYAQAVGLGTTLNTDKQMVSTITASTGGKNGQAQFALQCGYTDTSQCPAGTALAADSCCYLIPHIISTTPANGAANVCRNPLVSVEFDQEMDAASFAGKVTVTEPVPANGICPTVPAAGTSGSATNSLWNEFTKIFSRLIAYVAGRPAAAAPSSCTAPGVLAVDTRTVVLADGVTTAKHTVLTYALSAALSPSANYKVSIDGSVKTTDGIALGATPYTWTFTTGTDICTIDAVNVTPLSYLFSSQWSPNVTDPNSSGTFTATPVHFDTSGTAQPIAPIAGVYNWQTGWTVSTEISNIIGNIASNAINPFPSPGSVPGASVTVGVKTPDNGEGTLTSAATITDDTIDNPSTKGKAIDGTADLTIMICNDPWPARGTDGSWRPAQNLTYNYSFYYCRDSGGAGADLPALKETPSSPKNMPANVMNEYLYTYANTLGSEGIGIRVASNPLHLSAAEWFAAQGFTGDLKPVTVDGYDAVQDGSTIYVNAPALAMTNNGVSEGNFTNIYILSASVGAGTETSNIFGQIVNNMRFIANRDASGNLIYSDLDICASDSNAACGSDLDCLGSCLKSTGVCSNDSTKSCTANTDCSSPGTCQTDVCSNDTRKSCAQDSDCSFGACQAIRSKIRRDVKRLSDLRLIAEAASKVKDATGAYPQLPSGSFIPGQTVSTWPSWSAEFATELGGGPPTDPLNKMAPCPAGTDYETGTCWSPSNQNAVCPVGSHVYGYDANGFSGGSGSGSLYSYVPETSTTFFASHCDTPGLTQVQCEADPLCQWNGSCTRRYDDFCNGGVMSATGPVCGDGVVEAGKDCEKSVNPTQTIACGTGNTGIEVDTCGPDCHWIKGTCHEPRCGDGIMPEGNKVCDQGPLNGTYGHCNAACTGIGQSCGDGIVEQGEVCDNGPTGKTVDGVFYYPNGAVAPSEAQACAFDCHSHGQYCGDGNPNETGKVCDGNSQTSNDPTVTDATACPDYTDAKGNVFSQARTRTCNADCEGWSDWGSCLPAGSCGDGIMPEGNKQCDNGANNSDTGACTTACKKAVCGDGLVEAGVEECDEGAENIDPTDTSAIAKLRANCSLASCYYCSNTCKIEALSGPYCGDGNPNEINKQCDNGANNIDPTTVDGASALALLTTKCNSDIANKVVSAATAVTADAADCSYCTNACQVASVPYCGDGIMPEGDKACDNGPSNGVNGNGDPGSGCNSTCQCTADVIMSDASTMVGSAPAVVQNSSYTARFSGGWTTLSTAKYIWNFDESNPANDPAGWLTADESVTFTRTFTLAHPTASATLQLTADNVVSAITIDGTDITNQVTGGPPNDFSTVYSANITKYLQTGLTHTLTITAYNTPNGQTTATNPAMLIYEIISNPDCSSSVTYVPPPAPPPAAPVAVCGDGIIEAGEQCDNGSANIDPSNATALAAIPAGGSYCTTSCTLATKPTLAACAKNTTILVSDTTDTWSSANADMSGEVRPVVATDNYGNMDGASIIWRPGAPDNVLLGSIDKEYFQQNFTLNCNPSGVKFILNFNVDDDASAYVNNRNTAVATMNDYFDKKATGQFDVSQYVISGLNDLYFAADNKLGPGDLVFWITTQ